MHAFLNSALVTKPSPLASMALKAFSIFVSFIFDGGGRVGVSNFVKIVGLLRGHTYVTSVLSWREGVVQNVMIVLMGCVNGTMTRGRG